MLTHGLNAMQQVKLNELVKDIKGKASTRDIAMISKKLQCTVNTVEGFLNSKPKEPKAISSEALVIELKTANEKIAVLQKEYDELPECESYTGKQLYDVYVKAVGGKTFDDKPLPTFDKLGTQQKGWIEISTLVSK